jgi:hypothetical protein
MGLYFYHDASGNRVLSTTQAAFSIAISRKISNKQFLSAGLQPGYRQHRLDLGRLSWDSQYDGIGFNTQLPSGEINLTQQKGMADFAAGVNWHYGSTERTLSSNDERIINTGIAAFHLLRPDLALTSGYRDPLAIRFTLFGNAIWGIENTNLALLPIFFTSIQGPHTEITGNLLLRLSAQCHVSLYRSAQKCPSRYGIRLSYKRCLDRAS